MKRINSIYDECKDKHRLQKLKVLKLLQGSDRYEIITKNTGQDSVIPKTMV